ncbi:hypothetical protein OGH69_03420 [Flavobacterium sp. MFBS3-15]|uniref:hypothetical protein n=1 Tax=Flavobacterium sp. MFBS3-15 TaxID=2989816 RepID=UPI00223620F0|nr:hypothetical protein [Flavobacterium sp. MFBS3-15]MCW4468004.1 hypothetical protein [Flavobacterium sp. MFBS3-15]
MKAIFALIFLVLVIACKSKMPIANESTTPTDTLQTYTVTTENVMEASLYLPDKYMNFNEVTIDKDSILSSHLQIEMIEKELFEKMQGTAVNFWEEDAKGAVKIDTILTVKARDTILTFIDDTTDNETHRTFSYEGRLPVINHFVVLGTYYEDYGYMLFDMDTGYNTSTYQTFPLISPDKKYIVSLYADIYSPQAGELSIEMIGDDRAIPLLSASFTNWMPQELFFGTDGYLYVSINHPSQYWRSDGEVNEVHQYLRIKIL